MKQTCALSPLVLVCFANLFFSRAAFADAGKAKPADQTTNETASHRLAIDSNFRHDASLGDVQFIDASNGWATGDRGVIWYTDDGGMTWQQQSSGVTCSLNSVCFINAKRGWAVGGECRPFTNVSHGVVLRTDDGGQTWTEVQNLSLPRLRRVKFFTGELGVAIGDSLPADPSGVFVTRDGGTSWESLPTDDAGIWLAGDFLDADTGAIAGPAGRIATLARRRVVHSPLATSSLRLPHAMQLIAPTSGWLVGDGGLVLVTSDLGYSWQSPTGDLPEFAQQFDFHALDVAGNCVWIAGSPGTHVFCSPDRGQSWNIFPTGQLTPIRAMSFIDRDHGWTVGDLGSVLVTHDGGRSWKSQRSGGKRAALLGIFADASDVPLEVLADAGAADGYIAAVDLVHANSSDGNTDHTSASDNRARDAILLAGAAATSSAWRFPLTAGDPTISPADLLTALDRENDGRAGEQIERHIVQIVRMWRPDVVLTHNTDLERCEPRTAVLAALLMRSIAAAGDPRQHADLVTDGGLQPWQVKKVYGLLPAGANGVESVSRDRFSPWLGTTFSDFVSPARALIATTATKQAATYEFELLSGQVPAANFGRGLFSGITLSHGSEARRPQPDLPINDLAEVKRSAKRRRHLEGLLEHTETGAAWAAQIGQVIEDLRPEDGAQLLDHLANGYREAGRLDLAADTSFTLARRYPDHPLADRAVTWLVHFYASAEMGHRLAARQLNDIRQTAATDPPKPIQPTVALSPDDRLRRAIQMAEYLKTARPELYSQPAIRFAEVAAQRQLGFLAPAKRYFLTLGQLPEADPWRRCAETEVWLASPADLPPQKALGDCRIAPQRPHLDAKLDEEFWESADRLRLKSGSDDPSQAPSGEVRFAYDHDYLYVAVRCNRAPECAYESDDRPRPRDADLSSHDRVTLLLDMNRDFITAFELTVDSRGRTHDACWGDATWNPTWYVAAATDDEAWVAEAAIPLKELIKQPPMSRDVWAVAVRRTIPRAGSQSWSDASDPESPDRFGLLIFE